MVATLVAGAFAAAAVLLPHSPSDLRLALAGFGALAPLVALGAWALLTPALFPGTVLAAACGLAFGGPVGSAVAGAGAVVGGLTAFALARTVARAPIARMLERRERLRRAGEVLERRGFHAVLAARLMPGVPVTWLHYLAGVSPVRARPFAAAIAVGALLRTIPYAFLGEGLGSGSELTMLLAGASVVVGGVAAAALGRKLRQADRAEVAAAATIAS